MSKHTDGIRLVRIEGEFIRKLTTVAVRLDGRPGLYRVTGENEQGKTTFLDIVAMLFGGKGAVKTSTIQEGKDGAWCRAELSNGYSIERRFTAAAPEGYLDIVTPDNAKPRAPQTLLDGWCGPRALDPGALLRRKTKEIEAIILSLASEPGLEGKLEKLRAQRTVFATERTPFLSTCQRVQRTPKPEGKRPEPVDVSGEMERLKELRARAAEVEDAKRAVVLAEEETASHEARIAAMEEQLRILTDNIEAAKRMRPAMEAVVIEAKEAADALGDPSPEIEAVETRIRTADEVQRSLAPWQEWDRLQKEAKHAKAEADTLTKQIKALEVQERELLAAAKIPVPGISLREEDGTMLLDGHPIEVASGMRRLDMAVDVGFAANSDIRVILLDEANDYGLPALKRLHERAAEKGWQVLACRLGLEGPGEIIVQDGSATTTDPDAEQLEMEP
jgi:hypothetical protein